MEENFKSKLGFFTYAFIIIALLVGGYLYTRYTIENKDNNKKEEKVKESIKNDNDKDYFYYNNENVISESAEIYYKDIIINIKNTEELNRVLNNENEAYKNNIKYIKNELENGNLLTEDLCTHKYDDLYSLTFRDYKTYENANYLSLVIKDYNYTCYDYITFYKVKSYVFDKKTGELVNEDKLLNKYNINMSEIKNGIKDNLNKKQSEDNIIKIDETINNLSNYSFYIDEYNKLWISYLVKTKEVNYNEDMEVNV